MRTRSGSDDSMFADRDEPERDGSVNEDSLLFGVGVTTSAGVLAGSQTHEEVPQMTKDDTHSAVVTAIDNLLKVTTRTVEEETKWQLGADVTKEEIAQQTELRVFMFLRPNSPGRTVSMVHSIAQCWIPGQVRGKYVGVTGDATEVGNTLTAIALQEQKTWKVVKESISVDMEALVAEVGRDATVKTKIWSAGGETKEVEMPRIIHVPLCLAKHMYGEGKRYTPYDVNNIILTLFTNDEGNVPAFWEPISTWCLVAQQTDEICLDVAAITEPDR